MRGIFTLPQRESLHPGSQIAVIEFYPVDSIAATLRSEDEGWSPVVGGGGRRRHLRGNWGRKIDPDEGETCDGPVSSGIGLLDVQCMGPLGKFRTGFGFELDQRCGCSSGTEVVVVKFVPIRRQALR